MSNMTIQYAIEYTESLIDLSDEGEQRDYCECALEAFKALEAIDLIIQSYRDESEDLEDAFCAICEEMDKIECE